MATVEISNICDECRSDFDVCLQPHVGPTKYRLDRSLVAKPRVPKRITGASKGHELSGRRLRLLLQNIHIAAFRTARDEVDWVAFFFEFHWAMAEIAELVDDWIKADFGIR